MIQYFTKYQGSKLRAAHGLAGMPGARPLNGIH